MRFWSLLRQSGYLSCVDSRLKTRAAHSGDTSVLTPMGTLARKKELTKRSNYFVGGALLALLLVAMLAAAGVASSTAGPVIIGIVALGGLVLWFWGLGLYCESKGYSGVMAIIGAIGLIGLIILLVLPDKYIVTDQQPGAMGPTPYFRPQPGAPPMNAPPVVRSSSRTFERAKCLAVLPRTK